MGMLVGLSFSSSFARAREWATGTPSPLFRLELTRTLRYLLVCCLSRHLYTKLPPGIRNHHVLLCDPLLATGGSALEALRVLTREFGIAPDRIVFATLLSCPQGLQAVAQAYPALRRVVTAVIDPTLNDKMYIVPGLGDFGDRFYGTTSEEDEEKE
jgi:uracil phosphoribosyltransferase